MSFHKISIWIFPQNADDILNDGDEDDEDEINEDLLNEEDDEDEDEDGRSWKRGHKE